VFEGITDGGSLDGFLRWTVVLTSGISAMKKEMALVTVGFCEKRSVGYF
jgi:hypothetical protein